MTCGSTIWRTTRHVIPVKRFNYLTNHTSCFTA